VDLNENWNYLVDVGVVLGFDGRQEAFFWE